MSVCRYALDLSKRDPDDHVRDRARFFANIILSGPLTLRAGAVEKYREIIANRFTTLIDSAGIEERELKADT